MFEWMLGYVIVLLFVIFSTGSHKRYVLHWLFIAFFVISALVNEYTDSDRLFESIHLLTFMILIAVSEARYRYLKARNGLRANLFPIFLAQSYFFLQLVRINAPDEIYYATHSAYVILVTTALVTVPIIADLKKYRWMRQFLF